MASKRTENIQRDTRAEPDKGLVMVALVKGPSLGMLRSELPFFKELSE